MELKTCEICGSHLFICGQSQWKTHLKTKKHIRALIELADENHKKLIMDFMLKNYEKLNN